MFMLVGFTKNAKQMILHKSDLVNEMYRGKKVTNPVVHGATGGTGSSRYSDNNNVHLYHYYQSCVYDDFIEEKYLSENKWSNNHMDPTVIGNDIYTNRKVTVSCHQCCQKVLWIIKKNLTRAWNSVGKVKSDLRKIEHRLGNADHRQYPHENAEDLNDETDNQENLDYHHRGVKPERRKGNSGASDRNRDYDKHSRNSAASPKRVEFTDQNMERGINAEGSSSSGATGYNNYNHVNMPSNSLQQTTLTDSRAIRETEIRFLNEHHPTNNIEDEVRMNSQGTKFTHVNVTVPGSTKTASSIKNSVSGSTHLVSNSTSANPTGYNRVADNAALENDRGWETCSLDSASSEDHPISRRIKKSIKDIDLDQGLTMLEEKCFNLGEKNDFLFGKKIFFKKKNQKITLKKKEILNLRFIKTLENDLDNMGATGMTSNNDNVPRHAIHNDNEPVQARNYDLPPPEGASDRPRRKVAAGPPAPSYKGFSEAEIRFRHIDIKPTKAYDAKKKEKKKKLASKLQERRQQENMEFVREEERSKPKKATRVIAPSTKKQSKQGKQTEIITTSSWRAGQELILRELGPVKVRKTSKGSNPDQLVEAENLPKREMHLPDGATNNIDDNVDKDNDIEVVSHKTATAVELERARALSEEARKVLNDLQLDSAEEDDRGKENDGRRRSRPGGKRKAPKSNAERLKKLKDDELRQRRADENKRKQLEELRTKQKQNAALKIIKKSQHLNRNDETSESEKDKHKHEDEEEMELSEGSSTLTGEHGVDKKEKSKNKSGKTRPDQQDTDSHIPLDNDSNIKNIGGFKFNVDNVLNNFSQAMNNKRGNSDPRASSVANSGFAASGGSYDSASLRLQNDDDGHSRTRAERIQAIKSTAATLQSRIQAEARKLTGDQEESGAQNFHSQRTTSSQPPSRQSDDEFVSRYDRMTGAQNNYSDESSITETSTFSEITITEDSENTLPSPRRIGAGLRERDFHAGTRRITGRIPNEEPNIPRPNRPLYHNNRYSWEDPAPDPYNVLSISRSSQNKEDVSNRRNMPSSSLEGEIQIDKVIAQQSIPTAAVRGTGARSNSPVLRLRSDSPQAVSGNQKSAVSVKSRHEASGKAESASYQGKKEESDEDTLEAESYSQSFESEGDRVASKSAPKSLSERDQSLSLRGEEGESEARLKEPPRYSPNSLERRFYAELNQLESMEESMRQLVGVERTRAISMAQQETARQQDHEREMKNLELKAKQEALEATQQLEDARQRASEASMDAAETIAKFREGEVSNKEVARKLMATRKATAEASRYLAEAGGITAPISESDNIRPKKSTKQTTSISERMPHPESARSLKSTSRMTPSYTSIHSSRNTSRSDNVVTAEDSRNNHGDSDSSIRSVSGAEGRDESKTESIGEDISQASGDDYSITFDETMTEDEMEDRSFKAILPSESHRKRSKKHLSDNASVTSDEGAPAADVSHRVSLPLEDFVIGEDSFNKFTEDMVRQFMREEEMRAQHQASLLRLREKALVEKTKAELAWLELQKGRIRNKGADDTYPQIVKRQRGLKMKLQEQQFDDHSDAADHTQRKDYKSDSEIYTEPKTSGKKSKSNAKNVDKFLTAREQKLLDRRKNVEDLLKWKRRLDEEEEKIYKMEQKAIKVWDEHEHKKTGKDEKEPAKAPPRKETKPPTRKEVKDSITETVPSESNIISERVSTAKDDSVRKSYESPKTAETASGSESSPEEMRQQEGSRRSGSESSIPEEVQSQSSFEEATPGTRKSRASAADSYSNDTFEPSTTPQISRRSNKSPRSPLDKLGPKGFQILSGRDLTTPKSLFNKGRSSENVSYTETQSDLSDFEGRVKALTDDLKRRKVEADRLKKERKRRKREILKSKEDALRKQIEAYDNQISQLKADLKKEMEHEPQRTVKPQIKQPKVTPNKNLKKQELTPQKSNSNEDGFRSGNSSGYEDSSPSIIEDSKQTSPLVKTPPVSARVSLDKISEGSESLTSRTRTDKSEPKSSRVKVQLDRSASVKSEISTKEDKTEEIEEVLDTQQESETESSYSGILKIDKSPTVPQEVPPLVVHEDASYSLDFTEEPLTGSAQVQDRLALPDSARSVPSENVDSKLLSPGRSISEQISEHVSENIVSAKSDDAPFIKKLELQKSEEYEKDFDKESDLISYSTTKSDSRPSSGKSVSSQITNDDETESESERTPSAVRSVDNKQVQNDTTTEVKGEIKAQPRKTSQGLVQEGVSDIDKLLGLTGEEDEDEITPVASPRDEEDNEEEFKSGDRVLVTGPRGSRCIGNLMFKGKVAFAPGVWAGVELDAPEGRNDGSHDGKRYFTCRPNHGVLVPAADLMPAPVVSGFVSPGRSSQDSSKYLDDSQTDHDDDKLINEVPDSTLTRKQMRVDKLTNEILEDVVRENVNVVSQIADKKTPPPVAPKPRRKSEDNVEMKTTYGSETNGELRDSGISSPLHREPNARMGDNTTDKFVGSLLDDALDKMITIRKKQLSQNQEEGHHNDLISFEDEDEDFNGALPTSPTEELEKVLSKEDKDSTPEIPPRPVSPVPGSTPVPNKDNLSQLHRDMEGLVGTDDYIDDDMWPGQKAPPPYPDARPEITRVELQKLTEELYYAVPNKRSEIEKLVANAVDIFWNKRRYGEAINNVEPPDTYFTKEDNNNDLENNSRRVFKKLLFDLTGEVIQEIYKDDDEIEPPPWQKVKPKRQKYFRGAQPPREVEVLKPIVQEAVIDTLGINGSRKADKNKWSIRKKKDHVDTILVQELREEEPDWVNYDDDELAVKMQLTETIFDSLLSETAQTMNKIYRKRQAIQQK
ncbi:hypothetical protein KUTeg_021820 [Tegillarca granosa]|uniref:CAP-Gly domain-containing protein n=1 Tax=Tegillarca granosa TaxID=220873 RepID=A0ABQ9E7C7_TEGGR|nr:hypothetical protein KUTeg_021820 [Tegillarca granosa]